MELWKKKIIEETSTQGYQSVAVLHAWPILSQASSPTDWEIVSPCFRGKFNGPSGMVPLLKDIILMQKNSRYPCALLGGV